MVSVLDLYKQLDAEQRNFVQQRRLEGKRTPEGWLDFFKNLATFDFGADRLRKLAYVTSFACLLGIIILNLVRFGAEAGGMDNMLAFFVPAFVGFLPIFIGLAAQIFWLPYGILTAISLVHLHTYHANAPSFSGADLGITIGVLWLSLPAFATARRLAKVDIVNELREVIYPFLQLLREDMDLEEEIALQIDTSGKKKDFKGGSGPLCIDKPWCTGAAQLADGTRLSWAFSEKTSVGGTRRKHTKFATRIELRLRVPGKVYRVSEFDESRGIVWINKEKTECSGPDLEDQITAVRQRIVDSKGTRDRKKNARHNIRVEKIRVRGLPGEKRHSVKVVRTIKGRIPNRPAFLFQQLVESLATGYERVEAA